MSYLNIILAVWATCGIGAVLFIRGATKREVQPVPVPVQSRETHVAHAKKLGRTV